jgi:lycopene cyclase domain-containing protein
MNHFQYLIILVCCLAVTAPLEFLGARAYRQPLRLARSVLPVAAVFLVWDAIAIAARVWNYNPRYITGVRLPFHIPVEELLFFLVVPVCGILTYGCVQALTPRLHRRLTGLAAGRLRARREPQRASR